jgi:hypothetical protein
VRDLGRIPAQRSTTYGILKLYADGCDDDTSPLDAVENPDEQFGSYRRLTASSQFRFAKLKPPGAVRGGTELASTAGRLGECSETHSHPLRWRHSPHPERRRPMAKGTGGNRSHLASKTGQQEAGCRLHG